MNTFLGLIRPMCVFKTPFILITSITVLSLSAAFSEMPVGSAPSHYQEAITHTKLQLEALYGDDGPGAFISIIKDGKTLFNQSIGLADLDTQSPIDEDTIFNVGSVAKHVVAFATQLLIAEGKLSLESDVRAILPYMRGYEAPILVRDLIHHASGLKDVWYTLPLMGVYEEDALEQAFFQKAIGRFQGLNFPSGTQWLYSNSGYSVLADVVVAVSGKPFDKFTHTRIFAPLGMSATYFRTSTTDPQPVTAQPYIKRHGEDAWSRVPFGYAAHGASGLWTTANDMAKWAQNMLDPRPDHRKAMRAMYEVGTLRNGEPIAYASGLKPYRLGGHEAYRHDGYDQAFTAAVVYIPSSKAAGVILSNNELGAPDLLYQAVNDFFGDELNEEQAIKCAASQSAKQLDQLKGLYRAEAAQTALIVQRDGDTLTIKTAAERETVTVFADDRFSSSCDAPPGGQFLRDVEGTVIGLQMPFADTGFRSPLIYSKVKLNTLPPAPKPEALVGRYYNRDIDTILNIEQEGKILGVSNFRLTKGVPLKHLAGNIYHLEWRKPAYAEEYTLTADVEPNGSVQTLHIGNVYTYDLVFSRVSDAVINAAP